MIAKVTLTCSKCGKEYEITHGVQTAEEKESWEKWARETYRSPYCPDCAHVKDAQLNTLQGSGGGFAVAANTIADIVVKK